MKYPVESFSNDERARLQAHVTNLDQPVFALVNLPETVKGALRTACGTMAPAPSRVRDSEAHSRA